MLAYQAARSFACGPGGMSGETFRKLAVKALKFDMFKN